MIRKTISLIIVSILALVFIYNLISQIVSTLKSGDRLSQETEKLHQLEIQNKELKQKLSEVRSPEFLERQARDKLGLAKEDEVIVIIPDEKIQSVLQTQQPKEEVSLPNFLGWLRVFFK